MFQRDRFPWGFGSTWQNLMKHYGKIAEGFEGQNYCDDIPTLNRLFITKKIL
ncbi:hypothetical protein SAMN06296036_11445 [Pseudobacteriovorax antillogorgiicola]|uniref:Uncharacterized protein n=1 Tax=Pseudobacteriovorax antillogorgiicola TaxID=1513793 RepID=A0A1Y6CBJ6_9BACT|nr:hypothetical protein EDD56_115140 [Pseudobacteriovorax antillogorgiicola]SMF46385.1 hypothetical protein SAMN06296036_11445 [Pseudobacteriovorax antillogorgiicola]